MRVQLAVAAAGGLLAFVIGLSGADAAPPDYYVLPPGHETIIRLPASNGYRLTISSQGRYFGLEAEGPGLKNTYRARGRPLGRYGVQANLPGFGSIAVRFVPTAPKRQLHAYRICDGPGPKIQKGVVRGRIEFVGEGDYTEARTEHASAEVFTWMRQRCRYLRYHPPKHHRTSAYFLAESTTGEGTSFQATHFLPGVRSADSQVVFEAFSGERGDGVRVSRSIFAAASASSFQFPDGTRNPEHVIFEPPSPFSGTGTLQRTAESTYTWEGSLSVKFPGIEPETQLTGPPFRLSLCALRGCFNQSTPEEEEEFFGSGRLGRRAPRPQSMR
jgi:hypothetical protein